MNEDFSTLKAGDKVVIVSGGFSTSYRIVTIDKVTPTGIIKIGDTSYDQRGRERGGDTYHRTSLALITPEVENAIERKALLSKVSNADPKKLSLDQLRRVAAIYAEPRTDD